jgi:hypothetical protein
MQLDVNNKGEYYDYGFWGVTPCIHDAMCYHTAIYTFTAAIDLGLIVQVHRKNTRIECKDSSMI